MIEIDSTTIIIIAGMLAGLTRAVLGYLNRPDAEPFRPKAFARSFIISLLAGISAAYAFAITNTPIGVLGFLEIFFAVMGTDWLVKEGYSAVT
jgi:hypothetical protein